jgi:CO/xanthine dehydrogenase Mo-binding subunit
MSGKREFNVVGKARRRVDARSKVTGQTLFADDITLPRMLHTRLLRSPHAHARIVSIDVTQAQQYPGVHLVLTGKDFPVTFGIMPVSQDEYPLAPERVRYVGDPVAAVIARDEQRRRGVDLIMWYRRSRPLRRRRKPSTPEPRIHDYGDLGNLHRLQAFEFGDVAEALANSAHVFEDVFFYEGNTHLPIEQHASVAQVDGEGKLTLWSSTQVPHYIHRAMARALQMPASHIRVIACPNGGGFGGKCDLHNHEIVVSKAALKLGRPVKICLTREEVFYMHRGRHPVLMRMRTGVTQDGKITAMHPNADGSAYGGYGAASTFYGRASRDMRNAAPPVRGRPGVANRSAG